ncbi:MAG TPA: GNAT family N-acetyltransferase [Gammaproteobacteria bacterium]
MNIRIATRADVDAMHRVRLAVRENRLTRSVISAQDYIDAIERDGRGWVAEIDGVIRGFAIGNRLTGNIWALFVEPGFEQRGIGRDLHDAMLAWLKEAGCTRLWLATERGTRADSF